MSATPTKLVVRGASLLGETTGDLLVVDGVITEVGSVDSTGAEVVDADGLVALPGLVDLHTHLREPGREDAETVVTGSRAAAVGGFTAVLAAAKKLSQFGASSYERCPNQPPSNHQPDVRSPHLSEKSRTTFSHWPEKCLQPSSLDIM